MHLLQILLCLRLGPYEVEKCITYQNEIEGDGWVWGRPAHISRHYCLPMPLQPVTSTSLPTQHTPNYLQYFTSLSPDSILTLLVLLHHPNVLLLKVSLDVAERLYSELHGRRVIVEQEAVIHVPQLVSEHQFVMSYAH